MAQVMKAKREENIPVLSGRLVAFSYVSLVDLLAILRLLAFELIEAIMLFSVRLLGLFSSISFDLPPLFVVSLVFVSASFTL